jgi:NAD(P)-dependent dehydrogenase (short-subunit alcohol dehydrogenase family)
MLSRL